MLKLPKKALKQFKLLQKRLKSRGERITRREFLEFYDSVRKANAKGRRLAKTASALYVPRFSLTVERIKTRNDFRKYRQTVRAVLKRNYRQKQNVEIRKNLYDNLERILLDEEFNKTELFFENLTDAEFNRFFEENKELNGLIWESDARALSLLGSLLSDNLNAYIEAFE